MHQNVYQVVEEDLLSPTLHCFTQQPHPTSKLLEITSLQFRTNLTRGVIEEYYTLRCPTKGGRPALDTPLCLTARHFPSEVPQTTSQGSKTRRHCKVCLSSTRKSKQRCLTKHMCVPCNTPLCAVPCFQEYHTLTHY